MHKKIEIVLFTFILVLTVILRLYRIDNPIGDWHAFRQADTSAVSKVFVSEGINLLYPRYFDISNIQSGKNNPKGYRFVEFPIFNLLQASLFKTVGLLTLEEWGRIVTIISSVGSVIFIYLLTKKHLNILSALFASFFFAALPFSVYFGRVILPDPSTAMAILGGIYFFDMWLSSKKHKLSLINYNFIFAFLFTACSFLFKPFALFFTFPMVYLAWKHYRWKFFLKWQFYLFGIITLTPFITWRVWIAQFPEGIPVSNWLFNEGNIRFTGAYFYWIFAERISKLILGYFGVVILFLGLFKQDDEKDYPFFITFLISSLMYLVVIARGNVQHDYYQILIIPTICIFLGRGVSFLISLPIKIRNNLGVNFFISYLVLINLIAFILLFSWYHIRDYFNINNRALVTAGQIADRVLPKNAKVIASNEGDTSFLYYVNRRGWPAYQHSAEELKKLGAEFIIVPAPTQDDLNNFKKKYKIFYSSPEVLIVTL